MKPYVFVFAFACALSISKAFVIAANSPLPPDYDRRAAAALYSAKGARAVKPDAMDAKAMSGIRTVRDAGTGSTVYALEFGGVEDGKDLQGLYEVAVDATLTDYTKRSFKQLKNDPATGAEIFHFKSPDGADPRHQTIRLRKTIGRVTISVAQRRPIEEAAADAIKGVCTRFARLYESAKASRLLLGEIRLTLGDLDGEELSNGQPHLFSLSESAETERNVRIEVRDGEGNPVTNVRFLSLRLRGSLASLVRLKIGDNFVQAETSKYIFKDPGMAPTITLSFPRPDTFDVISTLHVTPSGAWLPPSELGLLLEVGAAIGDETTESVTCEARFQPIAWEPIITDFFASDKAGLSTVVKLPVTATPPASLNEERGEWMVLKPLVEPRLSAYPADADVITAWERNVLTNGDIAINSYGSAEVKDAQPSGTGPRAPNVHTLASESQLLLAVGLDATMNRLPPDRDELVKKYFKVLELSMTAIRIADEPQQFRAAVPAGAREVPVLRIGSADNTAGEELAAVGTKFNQFGTPIPWSPALAGGGIGLFEFRVTARIEGRVSDSDVPMIKTVRGAIRVAVVNDARLAIVNFDPR